MSRLDDGWTENVFKRDQCYASVYKEEVLLNVKQVKLIMNSHINPFG